MRSDTARPAPAPQVAQAGPVPPQAPRNGAATVQSTSRRAPDPRRPAGADAADLSSTATRSCRQQMETARRYCARPRVSPTMQAHAQARYQELKKRANDELTKQWTVWHERTKGEEAFRLGRGGTPAQAAGRHRPAAAGSAADRPDPRLGTPDSPQRTRIPVPPPPPPGVTPEAWSKEQTPQLAKADRGGRQGRRLQFDDAIKTLQLARQHPGREVGCRRDLQDCDQHPRHRRLTASARSWSRSRARTS